MNRLCTSKTLSQSFESTSKTTARIFARFLTISLMTFARSSALVQTRKRVIIFPYFPIQHSFLFRHHSGYPGLQSASPIIWSVLEKHQPYQKGMEWLGHFNKVNNENKHGNLVPQTRQETTRIQADIAGGGSVSWDPASVTFGAGVYIGGVPVDPRTQMPVQDRRLTVTKTIWVDFLFDGVGVSAIALLREALVGIKAINASIAPHI